MPKRDRAGSVRLIGCKGGWTMQRMGIAACLLLLTVIGCQQDFLRPPGQSFRNSKQKDEDLKTVGGCTSIVGADSVRVFGVGVVQNLNGTGGAAPPGEWRRQAIHDLKQMGVEHPEKVLNSPNVAVVMVSAILPPGAHKEEPIDVEVECLEKDGTTSLADGVLLPCCLHEYGDVNRMTGRGDQGARFLPGKKLAVATGPIQVGLAGKSGERMRRGRVWGGGKVMQNRDFGLLLNTEHQDARLTRAMAQRINERFYTRGKVMLGVAEAKTNTYVTLRVPAQYKNNWPRYLRVVRQISLRESESNKRQMHQRWAEELLNPATTVPAALKLEAIGTDAIAELKRGVASEDPLVKFCSAEAMAYLGDPAAAEPLHHLIEADPKYRAYGLTALAALQEHVAVVHLRQLLRSPSAETRYGAFRALRSIRDQDDAIQGITLRGGLHVHRVAPESGPMVHLNTINRAEVVLYGEEPRLQAPFSISVGSRFVLACSGSDGKCLLTRFEAGAEPQRVLTSLSLVEILQQMSEMGGTYGDAVELLQTAQKQRALSCPLAIDALPQAPSVYELARHGLGTSPAAENPEDKAQIDLGMTPNLFAKTGKTDQRLPAESPEE